MALLQLLTTYVPDLVTLTTIHYTMMTSAHAHRISLCQAQIVPIVIVPVRNALSLHLQSALHVNLGFTTMGPNVLDALQTVPTVVLVICSDNNFYMHGACVSTCSPPFLPMISGERRFCFSPCKETEIVYSDGTCTTACNCPFQLTTVGIIKLCKSPCPTGKILYYNQSCSTAVCPYPLFDKVYGGAMKVCEYPCSTRGEIYYKHNGTCQTSCIYPFITKTYGNFGVCEPPCSGTSFLRTWNNSCSATCPLLLQQRG